MRRIIAISIAILTASAVAASADPPPASDGQEQPAPRTRLTEDAPDAADCRCTHAIYFVAADGADNSYDVNGAIVNSMRSLRAWFGVQMQMAPRVDRIAGTDQFDITFVRGRKPAAGYATLADLTAELAERGFDDPAKRYLVYAGLNRNNTCGESTLGLPISTGSGYAAIYLNSSECQASDFGQGAAANAGTTETIAAHEWLHLEGSVSPVAPRHCPVSVHHVCTGGIYVVAATTGIPDPERNDVMYPLSNTKLSYRVLDRNRDDYLDHGLPGLPDLRSSVWLERA